ncbi:maternal B9.10 protein-like [Patiria miniata]|uniref:Anti-proliferative protein domain-containing protein n=1 Tax=Patiria miniata TaxID=46514 RepID=A0A914AEP6_PATMI|nr:maternal B9.10 protein-like [Patiria miniata]
MKDEIAAAVVFLARLINLRRNFSTEQMAEFSENLVACLIEKFRNHWYEDQPSKGQAFRCIRIAHDEPRDTVVVRAAKKSGLDYDKMNLPADFTLWVDPLEVVCRFGEKGTICPIASFPKKQQPTQVNDNEAPTSQSSDDNGNVDLNANPKTVIDSISDVLSQNASTAVNDNAMGVFTTHRRGRRNRTKYNLVRNAINTEQDWPALSGPHNQYRWVNKALAAKA